MNFHNVCRTCLRAPKRAKNLFEDGKDLLQKIETISSIVIEDNCDLPKQICEDCFININNFYNFRKVVINTNHDLKARLQTFKQAHCSFKPCRNSKKIDLPDEPIALEVENNLESQNHTSLKGDPHTAMKDSDALLRALAMKQIYKCGECEQLFNSKLKLYNHRRSEHVSPGVCNVCGVVVRADNLSKHIKLHSETPIKCKECGKVFKNSESLRSHKFLHMGNCYTCEFCGKCFKLRGEHTRHLKLHSDPDARKTTCPHCGKKVRDLKKHMLTHTGQKPYICQYCNKGFTSTYALKVHTRQHTNERPYTCNYCGDAFPQKVSLMTHLKSKHSIV
ncbi:zinc finger protein 675-like [Euwallacea similis]|uniref:zinc finger protein 675-like n=1 Tax=Euwallacea similis TaxID=1736056 RepID=UPI00344F0675